MMKKNSYIFYTAFLGVIFLSIFLLNPSTSHADLPGIILDPEQPVTTCGEMAGPGIYTLTNDITAPAGGVCFLISSDGVEIDGAGKTVTGSGTNSIAVDARAWTRPGNTLTNGANAYSDLTIYNIHFVGFDTGVNAKGNNGVGVLGGTGGSVSTFWADVGNIYAGGGDTNIYEYGGLGGDILITGTDVNLSNSTISALGGVGTTGNNTSGQLTINYTGTIAHTNIVLSDLLNFKVNDLNYGSYIGGTWPVSPGNISACGTLAHLATTTQTYILTDDIGSVETPITDTCFYVSSNNITINGQGHTVYGSSSIDYFTVAGDYSNFTLASTTVVGYSKLVNSNSSVTISSGGDLDLSHKYINAESLTLIYRGVLNVFQTTIGAISSLIINGINLGAQVAGEFPSDMWVEQASFGQHRWRSIASSADGTKLAAVDVENGYIYTSTTSGATWTTNGNSSGQHYWYSITSSADGTKLAAVDNNNGYIYTSTTSGATWTTNGNSSGQHGWVSIASSADGTRLAAVDNNNGYIYTSTDSGLTWTTNGNSSGANIWYSIASDASGSKLAAVVYGGYIYTSTDSGLTWTTNGNSSGANTWYSIASDASGSKLAAVDYNNGYIYTSTTSGATWTTNGNSSGQHYWYSITSSADGTKLAAVDYYGSDWGGGYIWTSADSGLTWTTDGDSSGKNNWASIISSADGTKLVAATAGSRIYTRSSLNPELSVNILTPSNNSIISSLSWSPYISWGTAISCEYSWNNSAWASSTCTNNGSDIPVPQSYGTSTLYIRGTNPNDATSTASSTFYRNLPLAINTPTASSQVSTWSPSVNWNADNIETSSFTCSYSYDNFESSATSSCSLGGSDILPPSFEGSVTLYVKVTDGENINTASVSFMTGWTTNGNSSGQHYWNSIASDVSGTKLVAVDYGGYIYTSTNGGLTWTTNGNSSGQHYWYSITSSADGTKLAAVVLGGYIYTSTNGGLTWTTNGNSSGQHGWYSITSSADGTKLAAVVYGGYIWTSTDSGFTWTTNGNFSGQHNWLSITSSTDGTKLAAVDSNNGYIYTSTTSGATWTTNENSSGQHYWNSITSDASGTKLVAVVGGYYIHTSTNGGLTWAEQTSSGQYNWLSIASSADGAKLAAVDYNNGYIYTRSSLNSELSVNILTPSNNSIVTSWSPYISWGTAISCEYSWNNSTWASSTCTNNGSDIPIPEYGTSTLYVRGTNAYNIVATSSSVFNRTIPLTINSPTSGVIRSWSPSVNWNADNLATSSLSCLYSYDNFESSATSSCSLGGSDIIAPAEEDVYTLSVKVIYEDNFNVATVGFSVGGWYAIPDTDMSWYSIASSIDGTRLVAGDENNYYLWTSQDSGLTWTVNENAAAYDTWYQVASDASGLKLAAVDGNSIWTSSDGGENWVENLDPSTEGYEWKSIASDASGDKLVAADYGGSVWTSQDSGLVWVMVPDTDGMYMSSIASNADGTRLVAGDENNYYLWTSQDSGLTWTVNENAAAYDIWYQVASDASGLKLAAVDGNSIWTSSDGGENWVENLDPSTEGYSWYSIALSADGTKLVAGDGDNSVWRSVNSGLTWTEFAYTFGFNWWRLISSADGNKLFALDDNTESIWTYSSLDPEIKVDILTPTNNSQISSWLPVISWGTAATCQYSWNNLDWTSSICANDGSDIPKPSTYGTSTLYVKGTNAHGDIATSSSVFYKNLSVTINSPVAGFVRIWSPSVTWNVDSPESSLLSCSYSYDNFESQNEEVDCALAGSDIPAPVGDGLYTLSVRIIDEGYSGTAKVNFRTGWYRVPNTDKYWYSIASSADGTRLVAGGAGNKYLWTSQDSGATWAANESTQAYNRWYSVTSDASGLKLAAVDGNSIWTSKDGGTTWIENLDPNTDGYDWEPIASDASGDKLVAADYGGSVWTSQDGGVTWVENEDTNGYHFYKVASNADGTRLLAADDYDGYLWVSTDSGTTWNPCDGNDYGNGSTTDTYGLYLYNVASDASGMKMFAADGGKYIYTSTDGGTTWVPSDGLYHDGSTTDTSGHFWYGIEASADGTRLVAVDNEFIWTSTDGGRNWTVNSTFNDEYYWNNAAISADGNKLVVTEDDYGFIWTHSSLSPELKVDILTPVDNSQTSSWSPFISWGTAVSCSYSWNNSDWTSSTCTNNGSDITSPLTGTSTLYAKGIDANNTTVVASSTFNLSHYIWCGTVDSNWNNENNWFMDTGCSEPAGVPTSNAGVSLTGAVYPIVNLDNWIHPKEIDGRELTGGANAIGIIFTSTSTSGTCLTAPVFGNATFEGNSCNNARVSGNVHLDTTYYGTALNNLLTLTGTAEWRGTILGNIYGSDNSIINKIIFNGNSRNYTTITGNPEFNDNGSNYGIITGSPIFYNTNKEFRIGTVVGTTTLSGLGQIISGTNSTINLVKNASARDTLYLQAGTVINVSGRTTLLGLNDTNLLTVASFINGANLNINGTSNLNYLKLIDIKNAGSVVNLISKIVYDGGKNSGFTFAPAAAPGGGSLTSSGSYPQNPSTYTPRVFPSVGPTTSTSNLNNNPGRTSGGSFLYSYLNGKDLGALNLSNLPKIGLNLGNNFGVSKFVNPMANLIQLNTLPISGFMAISKIDWSSNIFRFITSNNVLPKSLANLSNSVPSIKKELNKAGVVNGYDLYSMKESPVNTPTLGDLAKDKTAQPNNLIFTTVDGKERQTKLSIDGKENIYQIITVEPYASVAINVKNTDKTQSVQTTFSNKTIKSVKDKNNIVKLSLIAPKEEGSYKLKMGTLTLVVRVQMPQVTPTTTSSDVSGTGKSGKGVESSQPRILSPIQKAWSWFGK